MEKKKNFIVDDSLSSRLLFFFLYEPVAQWLSTKSSDETDYGVHSSVKGSYKNTKASGRSRDL